MEKKELSEKVLRLRKMLLMVPVMVLPFITLFFWALGGGQSAGATVTDESKAGINHALPMAEVAENESLDKMAYYQRSDEDSAKLMNRKKYDPYYIEDQQALTGADTVSSAFDDRIYGSVRPGGTKRDLNEERVTNKLKELQSALNAPVKQEPSVENALIGSGRAAMSSTDVDRLEAMLMMMNKDPEGDPEMEQINGTLEKILDIQHPQRVQEKLQKLSKEKKGQVFAVSAQPPSTAISLLTAKGSKSLLDSLRDSLTQSRLGFFSSDFDEPLDDQLNAISAVIHETQVLTNGGTVKMRLLNDVYVNGVRIPKNSLITGIAAISGDRLSVEVNSIRSQQSIFPVTLSAYDMDGVLGIQIPGIMESDVAKQSADDAVRSIGMNSLDPSIGAQAASAGLELSKNLFSKKVKLVKVTVKAGYKVVLMDKNLR